MSTDRLAVLKRIVKPFIPRSWILRRTFRAELLSEEAELTIVPLLCNRHGTCVDVGANIGVYSYVFSKCSKSVIAIEPHPDLAARLRQLLPSSVRVINIAASDRDGVSDFYIPSMGGAEVLSRSSLEAGANAEMAARRISVETRRLDSLPLAESPLAIVKIDVEGHEMKTLEGMTGILERSHPTLIVESEARHHPDGPQTVFRFLDRYGYDGYFLHRDRLKTFADFSIDRFQNAANSKPVHGDRSPDYVNNFIFVHRDRPDLVDAITIMYPAA